APRPARRAGARRARQGAGSRRPRRRAAGAAPPCRTAGGDASPGTGGRRPASRHRPRAGARGAPLRGALRDRPSTVAWANTIAPAGNTEAFMGTTVTLDTLRELAGFRAEKGRVISLYVDLHPSVSPSAADIASRVNALLDAGTKRLGDSELPRDAVQGLKSDFERIRTFLDQELDRDGARGLAIFADELDNLWRPLTLPHSVGDAVRVNDQLYLSPLVPLVGRGEGALVVFVGRERGDIYCLRGGRLEPVADQTEEQPGQHDQGGWSQARYQRHIENLVKDHLKRVAEALDRRVRRRRADAIVVVASEDTRSDFEDVLSKEVREAVVGWTSCEAHAGPPQVLEAVTPVLEEWRARREQELLERWREESAKNGRAAAGW